ncbi:hypothetical protein [Nostoc sp.]
MSVPVTLYSPDGVRSRQIAAIDAPGWIGKGWLKEPPNEVESLKGLNAPLSLTEVASDGFLLYSEDLPATTSPPGASVVIDSAASSTLGASENQTNKRGK